MIDIAHIMINMISDMDYRINGDGFFKVIIDFTSPILEGIFSFPCIDYAVEKGDDLTGKTLDSGQVCWGNIYDISWFQVNIVTFSLHDVIKIDP